MLSPRRPSSALLTRRGRAHGIRRDFEPGRRAEPAVRGQRARDGNSVLSGTAGAPALRLLHGWRVFRRLSDCIMRILRSSNSVKKSGNLHYGFKQIA